MTILEIDKKSLDRELTVWDWAMFLLDRYCVVRKDLIDVTGTDKEQRMKDLEEEAREIAHELECASMRESEARQKALNDILDYHCGRHVFYPFEA